MSHPPAPPATSSPVPGPNTSSSASGTRAEPAIDTRKGHDDYDTLMADVRAYCLAEYERIWGRPWDKTWPELHQHILTMRETAKRAHAVWSKLQRATEEAVDFVESQGLPPYKEPNFVARKGKDVVFPLEGKTVYETFIIHDWLHRYPDAVDALLNEDVERVHSPRSDLAEHLGRTLLEEPAPPASTIQWNTGETRGRELTEREMAYVSLLVGNEPSSLKKKIKDELVSVENVIEMEREAINSARVRHDEAKKEALAQRAAASSSQRTTGSRRAKASARRRS
ncbi:hypothetical protein [Sorangium sp. So ce1182]|uniref:hypothetical protein n=1 Tax=Sorangium sp. So ce1182 TaxID=3133334 RepID=UPI003F6109B5